MFLTFRLLNLPLVESPRRNSAPDVVLCLAIFVLALLPRLGALDRYVTPDELRWVDRSIRFTSAVSQGQWVSTIQSGHPGVITMWLGSLGIRLQHPLPAALPEFDPENAEVVRFLAPYLTAARLPVIFVVAVNIAVLFALLSRLIDRRAAFLAAALIALDPFLVALGSLLHVDALMTTFSLNSLAALCIALNRTAPLGFAADFTGVLRKDGSRSDWRWLIVSGVLAGLAMLSKSPAAILSVAAFLLVVMDGLRRRRSVWQVIRQLLIWSVSAAAIFFLLYPAMWVAPIKTVLRMRTTAENFSETAHTVNFFNGRNDRDPGPLFYPAVMAFRSTPVFWLGLIASVILIVRARSEYDKRLRSVAWVYWVFALVFVGVITLGAKKLDRYVLPTLEALVIVGAMGLAFIIDQIGTRMRTSRQRKWILNGIVVLILLLSAVQFAQVWPLPLRAYNVLWGGYETAKNVLPVGGGESAEVGHVLSTPLLLGHVIAASDIVGAAPFFPGRLVPATEAGLTQADYFLWTASDFQLTPDMAQKWVGDIQPVFTVTVQGQPFAWLYQNLWLNADRQRLQEQRQPDDAVLVDYPAALPGINAAQVITGEVSNADAVEMLQRIAQVHDRVWVIHYAPTAHSILDPILRLLDTHAVTLDEWVSPLSEGALYALPMGVSFAAQPVALNGAVNFGDHIYLHDAQLIVPQVQPGQAIGIFSQWTATGPAAQLEVSVVDDANHVWSTNAVDVPLQEAEPRPRERHLSVPVPLTMPPGDYQLVLNVIDTATGSPIHTRRADGSIGGIDWPLGSITIDPAQHLIDPSMRRPPITLNADLGGITAIGTEAPPDPIISGDPWTLAMEWTSTTGRLPPLDVQWEWAQNGSVIYSTTLPLNPYPTDLWRKGEVLQSKYDFRLPIEVKEGAYDLQFKGIDQASGKPLTAKATLLTPVKVAARPRRFTAPAMQQPLDVTFDELAKLIGADVDRSGGVMTVTLFWQAQAITTTNETTFVQLIGSGGSIEQQIDRWQIAFDAPTSTWLPGQVIADSYVFEVSSGEPQIGVGLYNAATGERLPAFAAGQRLPEDRVLIE